MYRRRHPRILIVDDDPVIRSTLEEGLLRRGFDVYLAGTAVEALQVALAHTLDLAILDFELPDRNGDVVYEALRQIQPDLTFRTMFISGSGARDRIPVDCPFLPKPFRVDQAAKEVRRLLRHRPDAEDATARDCPEDSLDPKPA